MPEIRVYFGSDGRVHIYWPKGLTPLKSEIQAIYDLIKQHRKSPSANGRSQKGSTENGAVVGHSDSTSSAAESQEGGKRNGRNEDVCPA